MFNLVLRLDNAVEEYLISVNNPLLAKISYLITELGSVAVVTVISLVIVYWLWSKGHRNLARYFVAGLAVNELLVYLLKNVVGRLRPYGALRYGEYDASMPSGHAAASIFVYGFICYLIVRYCDKCPRKNIALLFLCALIVGIGFSRLYLDVHYLSDVLVGYLLGGASLFYSIKASERRGVE